MNSNVPWLSVLWLVPLAGSVLIILLPPGQRQLAKWTGLVASVVTLAVAIAITVGFDKHGATYQFVESHQWIPAFGAGYTLGVDGIAVILVLLTAVLIPLLLVAGWNDGGERKNRGVQAYVALTLAIESMVLVSVIALDVLLFYVFFEAMLIPMYFLIGGFGKGSGRSRAAVKFLLYNLFGGLIMLAAVIGLYVVTAQHGSGTFDFREIVTGIATGRFAGVDPAVFKALFLGFMFAFAIKAPLWPLHRWLPDACVEATPATAVLITAVMDKVGTFGMLRYCLQLFPEASTYFRPVVMTLAIIGVIYGAIVAIGQNGHDAADRLHLDLALRLHRRGHLRDDHAGSERIDPLHAQPRPVHGGGLPDRGLPGIPGRQPVDRRLRRRAKGGPASWRAPSWSRPWRRSRCPAWHRSSASSWFCSGTFNRYWLAAAFAA